RRHRHRVRTPTGVGAFATVSDFKLDIGSPASALQRVEYHAQDTVDPPPASRYRRRSSSRRCSVGSLIMRNDNPGRHRAYITREILGSDSNGVVTAVCVLPLTRG